MLNLGGAGNQAMMPNFLYFLPRIYRPQCFNFEIGLSVGALFTPDQVHLSYTSLIPADDTNKKVLSVFYKLIKTIEIII